MAKDNSTFFRKKNKWSEVKDKLLGYYLVPYFQKVLHTKRRIFYVDCFAGKGRFDDGKDGSPRIALALRDDVIQRSRASTTRIDSCFIDLNYGEELAKNTEDFYNGECRTDIIAGKFEEVITDILRCNDDSNIFLYIDPYGIKALDYSLLTKFSQMSFHSVEMLINMNTFGFIRSACSAMRVTFQLSESLDDLVEYEPTVFDPSEKSIRLLNDIAGGDYWVPIIEQYRRGELDGYEAERRFSREYKRTLNLAYRYVLDMPICMNSSQHPKYRMIHVTNHEAGCILMAENMFKQANELFTEVHKQGQLSLLEYSVQKKMIDEKDIYKKMLAFMERYPEGITADRLIASFFTEYGVLCKPDLIRTLWKEMEKRAEITVKRIPEKTNAGKATAFFTEKQSKRQSVTIKRNW